MKNNDFTTAGGAKKFLYTGPQKDNDEDDTIQWNFNSKNSPGRTGNGNLNRGSNMEDVWSIKRNVNIGGNKDKDSLHYSTNKSYYSRYGGGGKEKEEFGASSGSGNIGGNTQTDTSNKGWNAGGNQSRRPFSYAFGSEAGNPQEPPVSPRNTSSSQGGFITPGNSAHLSGNTTNFSSFGARNNFSSQNGNISSSNTKSFSSPASQPFGSSSSQPKTMNNIFLHQPSSPKRMQNTNSTNTSSFNTGSTDMQKKSFW